MNITAVTGEIDRIEISEERRLMVSLRTEVSFSKKC